MGKKQLSFNEERVLEVLKGETFRPDRRFEEKKRLTIAEVATRGFPHVRPSERANSWVRNALRSLVALKLVRKIDCGTYQATKKGEQAPTSSRRPTARKKTVPVKVVVRAAAPAAAHQANGVASAPVEAQA